MTDEALTCEDMLKFAGLDASGRRNANVLLA
jgi:hypothetical protein